MIYNGFIKVKEYHKNKYSRSAILYVKNNRFVPRNDLPKLYCDYVEFYLLHHETELFYNMKLMATTFPYKAIDMFILNFDKKIIEWSPKW